MEIEKNINNLKQYIEDDEIYKLYKNKPNAIFTDFEKFCIEHCKDIENILKEREQDKARIKELEERKLKIKDFLENGIKSVQKCYEEMLTDIGGIKVINVTGLSRKEKEEITNKRNCLIVQEHCYKEILNLYKEENNA